jgi:hypothetical protein
MDHVIDHIKRTAFACQTAFSSHPYPSRFRPAYCLFFLRKLCRIDLGNPNNELKKKRFRGSCYLFSPLVLPWSRARLTPTEDYARGLPFPTRIKKSMTNRHTVFTPKAITNVCAVDHARPLHGKYGEQYQSHYDSNCHAESVRRSFAQG